MMLRRAFLLLLGVTFLASGYAAEPAPQKELPVGTWNHGETRLYVTVSAVVKGSIPPEGVTLGARHLTVGGPPAAAGNADDIFIVKSSTRAGADKVTLTGSFNWDMKNRVIEMTLLWKDGNVLVEVVKNDGYPPYPVGRYMLRPQKK